MNIKKMSWGLHLVVIGLVIWMAIHIIMTWASNKEKKMPQPADAKKGQSREILFHQMKSAKDFEAVIKADIFDTTKKTEKAMPAQLREKTGGSDLNLRLKGTVVGNGMESYAVIEEGSSRKEKLYAVNDMVQGAKVIGVFPDRVILSVDGKQESLNVSNKNGGKETAFSRIRPAERSVPSPASGMVEKSVRSPFRLFRKAPAKALPSKSTGDNPAPLSGDKEPTRDTGAFHDNKRQDKSTSSEVLNQGDSASRPQASVRGDSGDSASRQQGSVPGDSGVRGSRSTTTGVEEPEDDESKDDEGDDESSIDKELVGD